MYVIYKNLYIYVLFQVLTSRNLLIELKLEPVFNRFNDILTFFKIIDVEEPIIILKLELEYFYCLFIGKSIIVGKISWVMKNATKNSIKESDI